MSEHPSEGKSSSSRDPKVGGRGKPVTLKQVAEHLGLSPATVSVVLNRSPVADSIPPQTQERVFAAARELKYRPNHLARSLRSRRSRTVGVLVPEIVEPYAAGIMSGLESHLIEQGYFYLVASHLTQAKLLDKYIELLKGRLVEGLVLIATSLDQPPGLPTVSVSGHTRLDEVTNVVLDHDLAARQALGHLVELGHRRIALFKGQPGNADTEERWRGISRVSRELGLEIVPELSFQLQGDPKGRLSRTEEGYREGYAFGRELIEKGRDFSALFAFNDVSAIGATRAFLDAGRRVPEDISVVGFDDILSAAFHNPGLTTVRQPLKEMGETAGRILLDRLSGERTYPDFVTIEPELVVRASTGTSSQGEPSDRLLAG